MARIIDQDRYLIVDLTQSRGQRSIVIALALIFILIPLIYWGRIPRGVGLTALVFFAILLATLVAMVFFSRALFLKVVFDRTEQKIEYTLGLWMWRKRLIIPFAQVKRLKISPKYQRGSTSWELKLETQGGEVWPLFHSLQELEIRRFAAQAAQTLGCDLVDETAAGSVTISPQELGLTLRERYHQGMLNLEVGENFKPAPADCPIKIEEKLGGVTLTPLRRGPKIFMASAFAVFLAIVALQFTLLYARVLSRGSDHDPMMMKIVIMYVAVTILLFGFVIFFLWRRFGAQRVEVALGKLTFYHGPRYGIIPLEEVKDINATAAAGYPKVEIVGRDKTLTLTGWGNRAQNEWLAEKLRELVVKS